MTLFDQIWFGLVEWSGVEWHAVEWNVEWNVHDKDAVHLRSL